MKDKLLDLLASSVITQSLITVFVVGAWLYMVIAQLSIPPSLEDIVGIVVGFFFGSKYAMAMAQPYITLSKPIMEQARQTIQDNKDARDALQNTRDANKLQ